MEEFKEYPNKELYADVCGMLREITNPQQEKTKQLLEEEEEYDPRSDDVDIFLYAHFRKMFPKLEKYAKSAFMMIIKDHTINMNLLQNFMTLRERMYGKQDLSYDKATEIFGKELSKVYIEPLSDNPNETRKKINEIYAKHSKNYK